jgi:hypothetical protein
MMVFTGVIFFFGRVVQAGQDQVLLGGSWAVLGGFGDVVPRVGCEDENAGGES